MRSLLALILAHRGLVPPDDPRLGVAAPVPRVVEPDGVDPQPLAQAAEPAQDRAEVVVVSVAVQEDWAGGCADRRGAVGQPGPRPAVAPAAAPCPRAVPRYLVVAAAPRGRTREGLAVDHVRHGDAHLAPPPPVAVDAALGGGGVAHRASVVDLLGLDVVVVSGVDRSRRGGGSEGARRRLILAVGRAVRGDVLVDAAPHAFAQVPFCVVGRLSRLRTRTRAFKVVRFVSSVWSCASRPLVAVCSSPIAKPFCAAQRIDWTSQLQSTALVRRPRPQDH